MRKDVLMVVVGIVALTVTVFAGCSKGYEAKKSAGDITVVLKAERYPLIKGDNALSVTIGDTSGKAVGDAQVTVRYYMPPMPGMAPMEYNATATAKGDSYAFTANTPMEGGWKVDVTAARQGKLPVTATFNVDAR